MGGWTRRMGWLAMLVAGCAGEGARGRAPMAVSAPAAPPPGAAAPDATAASTAAPDASRGAAAAGAAAPDAAAPPPDPRKPTLELAFAGDVMFGRYVETGFREIPAIDHDPFAAVAQLLDSDFTLVNLEAPILRQRPARSPHGTRMKFVATPAQVARLVGANVDGVTLANNHAWDMRLPGVR